MLTVRTKPAMTPNGTAVEGVCVTGEAIRLIVPVVSRELSRWQASMARYLQSRVRLVLRSRYMMKVYRKLDYLRVLYPVTVRCCKYRDKQITSTDRVRRS